MTILAGIAGVDVIRRLAFLNAAVMAIGATAGHIAVIEHRTLPAIGGVAVIATVG